MRLRALVIAASLVAFAAPAVAQKKGVEVHDHRNKDKKKDKGQVDVPSRPAEARVTGFSPTSGPVGTVVTITGEGFLPQTQVKVGGRAVKEIAKTATSIQFAVPAKYYDGVITLHHPGSGNEIPVGTFVVQLDPRIAGFAPASGPVGTRVELAGEGFAAGDVVLFNGKPLPAAELGATRIVVVIPAGATTDFFTITRPAKNYASSSKQKFQVLEPAPQVSGLAPTSGPPGAQVRISGANFGNDPKVYYGAMGVKVVASSPQWIDVQVPPNAQTSSPFTIKTAGGSAVSAVFALVRNPVVKGFTPDSGAPGTRVDIYGDNFVQGDQVYFNGKPLQLVSFGENKLTVQIPAGAKSDRFIIWRGGQQVATAAKPFTVYEAPSISGFAPAQGPAGTRVRISGDNFGWKPAVTYGAQQLRVIERTNNSIDVEIPAGAGNQPFTVTTEGGSVTSATAFKVISYATIVSITPDRGPVGTRVTIKMNNINGDEQFWLNGVALPIVERPQGARVVQIPAGAKTGKLEWSSYGQRTVSPFVFLVLEPPAISGFSPASGPPGTQVTIDGSDFTGATNVYYGNLVAPIVKRQGPGRLVVRVPDNAAQSDYFWVEDNGSRTRSPQQFNLTAAIAISGFSPASGPAGTVVTIDGSGFENGTTAAYGATNLEIVSRQANRLQVRIPQNAAPGSDHLWVARGPWKAKSATPFQVTAPPPPPPPPPPPAGRCELHVSPTQGPAGSQVTVTGTNCNFGGAVKAWHSAKALQIVSVTGSSITATLPANAAGSDYISVEFDDGKGVKVRLRTKEKFTVGKAAIIVPSKPGGY